MLILTRNIGQEIVIGDAVRVTIVRVAGNQVAVGIEAPKQIEVHRKEIWDRIQGERAANE